MDKTRAESLTLRDARAASANGTRDVAPAPQAPTPTPTASATLRAEQDTTRPAATLAPAALREAYGLRTPAGERNVNAGSHDEIGRSPDSEVTNRALAVRKASPASGLTVAAAVDAARAERADATGAHSLNTTANASPAQSASRDTAPATRLDVAPATPASTAAVVEGDATLEQQVARTLMRHAANLERMTLKLHPTELGSLDIEFSQERGELAVVITPREASTRELLEASLQRLRQSLNDSGLNADVTLNQETPQDTHAQADAEGQRPRVAVENEREGEAGADRTHPTSAKRYLVEAFV